MSIKGLEQAIENLNSISKTAVPRASAQAVNRVANRAVSRSVAVVSKDTRVPRKLVKQRARVKRATVNKPRALIRVNRAIYRLLNSVPQACDFPAENGTRKGPTAFCV